MVFLVGDGRERETDNVTDTVCVTLGLVLTVGVRDKLKMTVREEETEREGFEFERDGDGRDAESDSEGDSGLVKDALAMIDFVGECDLDWDCFVTDIERVADPETKKETVLVTSLLVLRLLGVDDQNDGE